MKSDMHESASSLVFLDYTSYLKLILEILKEQPLFTGISQTTLEILAAKIALQVAREARARKGTRQELPLLFPYTFGTRTATIHMDGEQILNEMGKLIETLRNTIQTQLADAITESTLPIAAPEAFIRSLPFALHTLQEKIPKGLGYPFHESQKLSKSQMHIHSQESRPATSSIRYRGHKLTITLERTGCFEDDLIDGFCTLLQGNGATPDEITEVRVFLQKSKQDPSSELAHLKKLIKDETLGKIKLEAYWKYWKGIVEALGQFQQRSSSVSRDEQIGLAEMRRQLRLLDRFRQMLQDPLWADTDFQVEYAGEAFNVRKLFGRSDAYDPLPIFPEVAGTLGEVQNPIKDEEIFTYGLRFKLNGAVGSLESTFQYYACLLDPSNPIHQERLANPASRRHFVGEIFRIVILYFVVFQLIDDEKFEQRLRTFLHRLTGDDQKATEQWLSKISRAVLKREGGISRYEMALEQARDTLEAFLQRASVDPVFEPLYGYLLLQNGMLRQDLNRMLIQKRFFQPDLFTNEEHYKDALRYITLHDAIPQQDAFYALPVQVSIEPIYLSEVEGGQVETATMNYDIAGWQMLPIVFVPDTPTSQTIANQVYGNYKRVIIPYLENSSFPLDAPETALYRLTFLLLTYLCLDTLWSLILPPLFRRQERLFLPLLRVHEKEPETGRERNRFPNEEKAMRGITRTLAHMLSCERGTLANAQGFSLNALRPSGDQYRLGNGLSSLYNVLPRIITRPSMAPNALDKLAIIVISSRRSDMHSSSHFQRMCVYGEIIGAIQLPDGKLRIEQHSTFAVDEDSDNLYTTPRTLLDEVRRCYMAGYRHIFYVAKAPYTSHVHFTGKEESDELFFMSPNIIGGVLDAFPDIMLYPMFCDRYYTVKVKKDAMPESLYVDDTSELRTLVTDPNKSIVVFFNLMNGIQVKLQKGHKRHMFYNGVVSYSTLINMYNNPLYDQAIRNNLLDGAQPGSLRADLLDALAYLHGVRYERREAKGVQLKLDPYDAIIGFDSVGARAMLPSMDFRVQTNFLALLTLVRGMIRRKKEKQPAPPPSTPPSIAPSSDDDQTTQRGVSNAE